MSESLVVPQQQEEVPNLRMVALTPGDVSIAQQQLSEWCDKKIASLEADAKELEESLEIAARNRWRQSTLQKHLSLSRNRIVFYQKIKAASEAGYLIVPNFDVEVMAVRVKPGRPMRRTNSYINDSISLARPQLLAAGEGVYVDERVLVEDASYMTPDGKGGEKRVGHYASDAYDEPDFPVALVKPIILHATELAMSKKIFDRIGVVTGKKTDPVVVGQIIDPRGTINTRHQPDRFVSFFIAWWLDTDML